jgi:hypothetical protein|mmetsp:Transcript_50224/g.79553  ORF Transcript_50224/g.79553 Transcript_50224/m.79553 type:complete len:203 (-) Transcript_50224:204-812(-)|eukprot:CAMPEP_0169108514 /NCGR_PEP_ID=MMETSP1015-20121227/25468_1 /TAXON_ID=342587 /ORGANISM="Karlodinium micrum, Strain CCMP2283" /LENGTH=202 /DNA_ID=CAMNT_0009170141 /DNA_START=72 /DNA_END=680 /DNA_ORIENTATION=-
MRVAWDPASSTPRDLSAWLPASSTPSLVGADMSANNSGIATYNGAYVSRKNLRSSLPGCLPVRGSAPLRDTASLEVIQLRQEVERLRGQAQQDAKERDTLKDMIDKLKTELRHALDDNRKLTDGLEERKQILEDESARRDAAARESALNSAKDLFKSMLENSNVENEKPRNGRDHTRNIKASSHKRKHITAVSAQGSKTSEP